MFFALVVTGVILADAPKASATNESVLSPGLEDDTTEQYPISEEEYLQVKPRYRPQIVDFPSKEPAGTIIIDTKRRFLYLVLGSGRAKRYGVGVGRRGFQWSGTATIGRKAKWPTWIPPQEMMERDREAAKWPDGMPGGPENPLGARALYLYQNGVDTLYRIHGTREPHTIGRAVSSGCVRMLNADAADLFDRAPVGAKVVVVGPARPASHSNATWTRELKQQPAKHWKQFKRDFRKLLDQFD
jgi:lipoprotein-anchoring transpeptidase ErfK/SrfK